jgi:hypothetical protein
MLFFLSCFLVCWNPLWPPASFKVKPAVAADEVWLFDLHGVTVRERTLSGGEAGKNNSGIHKIRLKCGCGNWWF